MKIGMLWLDSNTANTIDHRIQRACRYYREKYGQEPSICFVNPLLMDEYERGNQAGIEVCPSSSVQPDHFWVGVKEPELKTEVA